MHRALSIFSSDLLLSGAFVGAAWSLIYRLVPQAKRRHVVGWLVPWSIKGLAVPILVWILMNIGLSWRLQPFMPQIQAARNSGGPWFSVFLSVVARGLVVVSSYWTAATFAWVLAQAAAELEEGAGKEFKAVAWTSLFGMSVIAIPVLLVGGWPAAGIAVTAILLPIAGYAPGIIFAPKPPPLYSRAIGKLKMGKYAQAELEIIRQLEHCEDDFDGWMMLAGLYAEQFHDLPEAEQTIMELCDQPEITPSQVAVALHKLANWHLKLNQDPHRARHALQLICNRMPGTHLARMAALRIRQLPTSVDELRSQQPTQTIPLPALGNHFDESAPQGESPSERLKAIQVADACVKKLNQDPNDIQTREKLARAFAEHLGQARQAIEQVLLLLDLPEQPASKRAEWLSLIAAWRLKYCEDFEGGRTTLERLIREYPKTPQALAAKRRLQLLERRIAKDKLDLGGWRP